MYYNNILEAIGDTPLVKIQHTLPNVAATVLGKVEFFNPGNSVKDRMALEMITEAEKTGQLKPGGTIIETTSGNTGFALALVGIVKGYKCIFAVPDKLSKEKLDSLRALGVDVRVCPSNVKAKDPRSYYSVAKRLSLEIPNSYYVNQYFNPYNVQAHYNSTGPEIWRQTAGKITHFIAPVGTGGTISGTSKFLKEMNPNIKVIGVDAYGSVLTKYHETGVLDTQEIKPYLTEGVGKNMIPDCVKFNLIDQFVQVSDRDGALTARELAQKEGLFVGYSSGTAMHAVRLIQDQLSADDVVVVILHDHGSRYVSKIYNDAWMRQHGFLAQEQPKATAMLVEV